MFFLYPIKLGFKFIIKLAFFLAVFVSIFAVFYSFIAHEKPSLTIKQITVIQREEMYKHLQDQQLKNDKGQLSLILYRGFLCSTIGETCTDDPNDGDENYKHSLFGQAANLLIAPYLHPPASGIAYVYDGLRNSGFISQAYASEGIGFGSIKSISGAWKRFRDVSYLILVLIIVSISFMIMFRMKLNPQTVIGIENALPRIAIALILITFSFPIAGFLIDLMYIFTAMIISLAGPIAGIDVLQMQSKYIQAGPDDIFSALSGVTTTNSLLSGTNIFWKIPNALIDFLGGGLGFGIRAIGGGIGVFFILPFLFNFWDKTIGKFDIAPRVGASLGIEGGITAQNFFGALANHGFLIVMIPVIFILGTVLVGPILIGLMILVTLIFLFFRILFMLLSSYIKIFLLIILSPLILIFEAIPGRSTFSTWLKSVASELLTFPLIVGIVLLSTIILKSTYDAEYFRLPFLFGVNVDALRVLTSMAILFMTPDLITLTKQLLIPKPLPIPDAGPGIFFGGVTTSVSAGLSEVNKYSSLAYYTKFKPLENILKTIGIKINEH